MVFTIFTVLLIALELFFIWGWWVGNTSISHAREFISYYNKSIFVNDEAILKLFNKLIITAIIRSSFFGLIVLAVIKYLGW